MLAGVAHDLGRRVEAHRLAVEQGRGEDRGVVTFEPGRDIGEEREAGRMAFGKPVIAKALDLTKATLGEVFFIAAGHHAAHHLLAEAVDLAGLAEGRHGPAQGVGLGRGEAGGDDGDAHRLLLKERYAQGLAEHLAEFVRRKIDPLFAVAPAQIGVDHVALDRPGADDRDLDDEVVEAARLEARQHRHLGPALDLEDADRVRPAQHVVDGRVLRRHAVQAEAPAVIPGQQIEALADAGQHAEGEDVDLEDAEGVEVVLVPLDEGTVGHGGILDRHHLGQRPLGDDEPADMLGEVAGRADQFARQIDREAQRRVVRVEPGLADGTVLDTVARPAPDGAGQRPAHVFGQPHRLAGLADGAAGPVGDDGGGDAGALAAVFLVDVLDHLLAALVLEIDVDVGRLVALGRNEALEQKLDPLGIDGGNAEAVADGGIRRRAPALAQDAAFAGEADNVVDGEEVGGVFELGDQRQFVDQGGPHFLWNPGRIVFSGPQPGQPFELFLGAAAAGHRVDRVFVAQLVEAETAAPGDLNRTGDGLGMAAEKPRHLGRGFEVPLGVRGEAKAGLADRAMRADAADHVLQRAALGDVVVDIVGGHQAGAPALGEAGEAGEPSLIVAAMKRRGGKEAFGAGQAVQPGELFAKRGIGPRGRQGDENLTLPVGQDVFQSDLALALPGAALAQGEQAREPAIGGPVGGKGQGLEAVAQHQPRADDKAKAKTLGRDVGADDAGEGVVIGDGDGLVAEIGGPLDQLLGVRGPAQEAEIAGHRKLGVGGAHCPAKSARCCTREAKAVPATASQSWLSAVMSTLPVCPAQAI